MGVIKKLDAYRGVRFWAQWYNIRIPRYDVYRYYGFTPDTGTHWFQDLRTKQLHGRNEHQLRLQGWAPFVVDSNCAFPMSPNVAATTDSGGGGVA